MLPKPGSAAFVMVNWTSALLLQVPDTLINDLSQLA